MTEAGPEPPGTSGAGWIAPLRLGGLELENNLIQAPLAGYSSLPFRLLSWIFGRPGLLATEMISAKALCLNPGRQERYLAKSPREGPILYQIWGADPEAAAGAASRAAESGASAVDLNCGCPVRKVRAAGAGSKLMENPRRIGRLVAAMRKAVSLPVSIKIRVGPEPGVFNAAEVARIAEQEGADWLTVHGRHAREAYGTPCRLEEIAKVRAAAAIPVVGNGDVRDGASAVKMLRETGVAGVMVGRACLGAPWVFARIRAEAAGKSWTPPAAPEIGAVILRHHDLLAELLGPELAVRQCRKLGAFYSRALAGAREFRGRLNFCRDRAELGELVERHFGSPDRESRPGDQRGTGAG